MPVSSWIYPDTHLNLGVSVLIKPSFVLFTLHSDDLSHDTNLFFLLKMLVTSSINMMRNAEKTKI